MVLDRRQEVERVQVLLLITEVQAVLVKMSRLENAAPTTAQVCLNARFCFLHERITPKVAKLAVVGFFKL